MVLLKNRIKEVSSEIYTRISGGHFGIHKSLENVKDRVSCVASISNVENGYVLLENSGMFQKRQPSFMEAKELRVILSKL